MNFKCLATIIAAITITSTPMLVRAQASSSVVPVVVTDVQVYEPESGGFGDSILPGRLDLEFHAMGNMPANDIIFSVGDEKGNDLQIYDVRGSFAPNIAIHRTLLDFSFALDPTVTVVRVTFADGSTWFK